MKRCPITYEEIPENASYSKRGLYLLSPRLTHLQPLPYTADQQRIEAAARATKLSIQGVQPKLSARLSVKNAAFELTDSGGTYILKPPHLLYPFLPENEALTMRLAATVDIEVPVNGLIYASDSTFTYFIRRFDRFGHGKKRMQEDFAQLTGKTRDTKYDSSVEQLIPVIEEHCTFPMIEKIKLFTRVLFSFLTGNEDMHLKNYSLLVIDRKIELSPAYDLLNTTLALPSATEETALSLKGRKKNQTSGDFLHYFAKDRLKLTPAIIDDTLSTFSSALKKWSIMITESFLPSDLQERYWSIVEARRRRLFV